MEYYSAKKKKRNNAICSHMMDLEIIVLSKYRKDKYHTSLICVFQNMTQINISMKQNQNHRLILKK